MSSRFSASKMSAPADTGIAGSSGGPGTSGADGAAPPLSLVTTATLRRLRGTLRRLRGTLRRLRGTLRRLRDTLDGCATRWTAARLASGVCRVAPQAFLGVFDEQFADRQFPPLGLGGEPLGQRDRHDHGAADAIVALPRLVRRLRHAPSFPARCSAPLPA